MSSRPDSLRREVVIPSAGALRRGCLAGGVLALAILAVGGLEARRERPAPPAPAAMAGAPVCIPVAAPVSRR